MNSFAGDPTNQVGELCRAGVASIFQLAIKRFVSSLVADVTQFTFHDGNLGIPRVGSSNNIAPIPNWNGLGGRFGTKFGRKPTGIFRLQALLTAARRTFSPLRASHTLKRRRIWRISKSQNNFPCFSFLRLLFVVVVVVVVVVCCWPLLFVVVVRLCCCCCSSLLLFIGVGRRCCCWT